MPVDASMRFWITIDEELVGALDQNGCFANPTTTNEMLGHYGITEPEDQKLAREVLRYIGVGRAEALFEDDDS